MPPLAEKERSLISQRTHEASKAAKAAGASVAPFFPSTQFSQMTSSSFSARASECTGEVAMAAFRAATE
jgi:hypothetical protein